MKCEIGDIVLVKDFKYPDGRDGTLHYFVVIDVEQDELAIFPLDEYLGFIVSSKKEKETYPYNIPIKKDEINRLQKDSHVKCDYIYEGIKEDDVLMKLGMVTQEQYDEFIDCYEKSKQEAAAAKEPE